MLGRSSSRQLGGVQLPCTSHECWARRSWVMGAAGPSTVAAAVRVTATPAGACWTAQLQFAGACILAAQGCVIKSSITAGHMIVKPCAEAAETEGMSCLRPQQLSTHVLCNPQLLQPTPKTWLLHHADAFAPRCNMHAPAGHCAGCAAGQLPQHGPFPGPLPASGMHTHGERHHMPSFGSQL
jgi:hypothetical protein